MGHTEGKLLSQGDFEVSCAKGAVEILDTEALAFSSSATKWLGKSLYFSVPQCPHLKMKHVPSRSHGRKSK